MATKKPKATTKAGVAQQYFASAEPDDQAEPDTTSATARRERVTFYLDAAQAEQVRDAAYHLRLPMGAIVSTGIELALAAYAEENNKGRPFPRREGKLLTGRPPRL